MRNALLQAATHDFVLVVGAVHQGFLMGHWSVLLQGNGSSYISHSESKERNGALVEAKADN